MALVSFVPGGELVQPPRLNWKWVMLLNVLTVGVFGAFWLVIQADWVRRVRSGELALGLAIASLVLEVIAVVEWVAHRHGQLGDFQSTLYWAVWIACVYMLRWELEGEPIGLSLGWFMPLFFGPVYFQYRIADLGMGREAGRPLGL